MLTKWDENKRYLAHLGIILSNISIVMLVMCLSCFAAGIFSFILSILWVFLWLLLFICTVGVILVNDKFNVGNVFEKINNISDSLVNKVAPIIMSIALLVSILSLAFLLLDRNWVKAKKRITFSIISIIVIAIIIAIRLIIGGAK